MALFDGRPRPKRRRRAVGGLPVPVVWARSLSTAGLGAFPDDSRHGTHPDRVDRSSGRGSDRPPGSRLTSVFRALPSVAGAPNCRTLSPHTSSTTYAVTQTPIGRGLWERTCATSTCSLPQNLCRALRC